MSDGLRADPPQGTDLVAHSTKTVEMRLAQIRERAEKAIPAPWYRVCDQVTKPEVDIVTWAYRDLPPAEWEDAEESYEPTLDFIAHAREDVPWLLALLKEHDERIKQLEREATVPVARSGGEPA